MFVVCDIETNRLINPDTIHCIVCKETETGKVHEFYASGLSSFVDFASLVTCWVGHNFLTFDRPHLNRLMGTDIRPEACLDTLVCSRLFDADLDGGHSLEAWGVRLGVKKEFADVDNKTFWNKFSEDMLVRCRSDAEINFLLFKIFSSKIFDPNWSEALRIEHELALFCDELHVNGFPFDIDKAQQLYSEITEKINDRKSALQAAFPPRSRLIREITPRATAHGTLHRGDFRWVTDGDLTPYSVGAPFSRISFEPFNPRSTKQLCERLDEAGWKPYEPTDSRAEATKLASDHRVSQRERDEASAKLQSLEAHGWKISENNLNTLPDGAPEAARGLVLYLLLTSRQSTLESWFNAYDPITRAIHGRFIHIGAWTHRVAHSGPNMGNIPTDQPDEMRKYPGQELYGDILRSLWTSLDNFDLVGVDADGIQLRVLAHYINDNRFTESLLSGDKEKGTDPHSLNRSALGPICGSRESAKTFIYAWLLGAGTAKVATILGCSQPDAREAVSRFIDFYPGLKDLKANAIVRDAMRGWFTGFDGRIVRIFGDTVGMRSHLALAGYLQNGEKCIMGKATTIWRKQLDKEIQHGLVKPANWVHDEWQTQVLRSEAGLANYVMDVQAKSIESAGIAYNVRCPMAGSVLSKHKVRAIGRNWAETH